MNITPRHLPQIETLLSLPALEDLVACYSRDEVVEALRGALQHLREAALAGTCEALPDFGGRAFVDALEAQLLARRQPSLRPVINATGVIVHTNLGRARLAPEAMEAMAQVAAGGSNLELDLETGARGSRYAHVEDLICALTGAEAALVVNNCAAAVVLSLMALAQGKEVIASRGELIEIGGSFRLPDVIAQSGAILKEVGTTNKTRIGDYAGAVGEDTAVLLKSHTSNFRIVGFTASPTRQELAVLARAQGVLVVEDLGSGTLVDLTPYGLKDEPVVADIIKAGVDLVMFSGDKMLGGPQCGILAGRASVMARLRHHPLLRALRIDKLSLAALEATLRLYRPPNDPFERVPVLSMIAEPVSDVRARATRLAGQLRAAGLGTVEVRDAIARVGGGAMPQQDLPDVAVSVADPGRSAQEMAEAFRRSDDPVVGRLTKDRFQLHLRTVTASDLPRIVATARGVLGA